MSHYSTSSYHTSVSSAVLSFSFHVSQCNSWVTECFRSGFVTLLKIHRREELLKTDNGSLLFSSHFMGPMWTVMWAHVLFCWKLLCAIIRQLFSGLPNILGILLLTGLSFYCAPSLTWLLCNDLFAISTNSTFNSRYNLEIGTLDRFSLLFANSHYLV